MKLNIGDGGLESPGYIGWDIKRGQDALDIKIAAISREESWDGKFDEIRASHILEHFPAAQVSAALQYWASMLKPGGVLKIAVPDFKMISEQYLAGAPLPIQGYVMGGQVDEHDFHKTIFDEEVLSEAMRAAGLISIRRWEDDINDCSRLPISLNLAGTKPRESWPSVAAVISMPRLGFNDFWACALRELGPIGIHLRKVTGAYWDRDLTDAIEQSLNEQNPEWILTCDYDTVFTRDQLLTLLDLAVRYPEADAIAPLQTARHHNQPMFSIQDADGKGTVMMQRADLMRKEVIRATTAHFGFTLIRASKLKAMPTPWFNRTYGEDGRDPDVQFWHNWKAAGNTLFIALRVPVGHCENMIRWPNVNFETIHQTPHSFFKSGPPEEIWR